MADLEEIDRLVRQLRNSSWLDPATAAGSLPKVPTTTLGTLPTATADFRGRIILVYGAAGVADGFFACMKDAADAYSWVALPNVTPVDLTAIDFLVGTASGLLSGEIVAGTAPGGELGGTWASPTVDATHSGSSHASVQGAVILRYSSTAEVTTTSTGAVDLWTSGTLAIPVTNGIIIQGVARKTAGAAALAAIGLKVNSTVTCEAAGGTNRVWVASATNQAEDGTFCVNIMPRSANYLNGASSDWVNPISGVIGARVPVTQTAALPNATVTAIVLRGIVGNALVTLAVKEVAVYEVAYA